MKIKDITSFLETIAPPVYQESYDNSGLLVGDPEAEITSVLISLDTTEAIVEEAIQKNCNLIVSHHPVLFNGIRKLTGSTYIERVILAAVRNGIAIYAIHTNLDNMLENGVNGMIADRFSLEERTVLRPKKVFTKLVMDVSSLLSDNVKAALDELNQRNPGHAEWTFVQLADKRYRFKIHCPMHMSREVRGIADAFNGSLYHWPSDAERQLIGAGIIGHLHLPMPEKEFLSFVQHRMQIRSFRHTPLLGKSISKVAICGGSGSFLLDDAKRSGADVFISADFKYHQFFDAEEEILILDIGHYESEKFTVDLLHKLISGKFANFAALKTEVDTNPVCYYK